MRLWMLLIVWGMDVKITRPMWVVLLTMWGIQCLPPEMETDLRPKILLYFWLVSRVLKFKKIYISLIFFFGGFRVIFLFWKKDFMCFWLNFLKNNDDSHPLLFISNKISFSSWKMVCLFSYHEWWRFFKSK